jgi:hypothetical protein
MARPLERKKISDILTHNRRQRKENRQDMGSYADEDPLADAVTGVPEVAPEGYGADLSTTVLGDPNDPGLSEEARQDPAAYSQRYATRAEDAGPDDLTLASPIRKKLPSDVGEEASGAAKSFPTEQVSFGGAGNYNYTFIPTPGGEGPGIIKGEGIRDGKLVSFVLDPAKGLGGNEAAYGAILKEMATKGYGGELHDLSAAPAPAPEAQVEVPPIEEMAQPGDSDFVGPTEGPTGEMTAKQTAGERSDDELRAMLTDWFEGDEAAQAGIAAADRTKLLSAVEDLRHRRTPTFESLPDEEQDISELPLNEARTVAVERAMKAEAAKADEEPKAKRAKGDVGGKAYDAVTAAPGAVAEAAREAHESIYDPTDDVPGYAGPYSPDAAVAALKERAIPDPRRAEGDIGGRISDFIVGKQPGWDEGLKEEEAAQSEIDALAADLLGPSFAP